VKEKIKEGFYDIVEKDNLNEVDKRVVRGVLEKRIYSA
jgi:hypothetical protein